MANIKYDNVSLDDVTWDDIRKSRTQKYRRVIILLLVTVSLGLLISAFQFREEPQEISTPQPMVVRKAIPKKESLCDRIKSWTFGTGVRISENTDKRCRFSNP